MIRYAGNLLLHLSWAILALFFIAASPATAQEESQGMLITNNETGQSIWLNTTRANAHRDYMDPRAQVGCDGFDDYAPLVGQCSWEYRDFRHIPQGVQVYRVETGDTVDASEYETLGSWAVQLFNYAMGFTGTASCLTCDFIGYFMLALTSFSSAVFTYFLGAFRLIVPVLMAIWIGYRVAKLMSVGGEDGRSFIYSIVSKLTLFSIIWLIATSSTGTHPGEAGAGGSPHNLWRWTGPVYLQTAFELSGDIRDHAIRNSGGLGVDLSPGEAPFGCDGALPAVARLATTTDTLYIRSGIEITCVTERTHITGIASGLAVVFTAWAGTGTADWGFVESVLLGLVKLFAGVMMMAVYILSAVWLIFLILDVVARGLVTAAFSPLLAAMFLFQPTRGYTVEAIKAMAGAMVTAISLSIIAVLAFFLMTNVIDVYEALWPGLQPSYPDYTMASLTGSNMIDRLRNFIERIQEDDLSFPVIPMDFSTPWFYYICMAGVATFALGKKIITMMEALIGYKGAASLADNALKMTKAGAVAGMGAAGIGAVLARKGAGAMVGGAGAISGGLGQGAAAAGNALSSATAGGNPNPFSNPAAGAMGSSISSGAMRGNMGAESGQ